MWSTANYEGQSFIDLLASGQDEAVANGDLGLMGSASDHTLPFISLTTGEVFRFVEGFVSLHSIGAAGGTECEGRARLQYAPRIAQFYR
jgi:hypothetical protein